MQNRISFGRDHQTRDLHLHPGDVFGEVPVAIQVPVVLERRGDRAFHPERVDICSDDLVGEDLLPDARGTGEEETEEAFGVPLEQVLGGAPLLELKDVVVLRGPRLTDIDRGGNRGARKVGRVEPDDARRLLRIEPGERPGKQAAPVMSHHDRPLVPQRRDHLRDTPSHPQDVVIHVGFVGASEAGEVDRNRAEASIGDGT